MVEIIRRRIKSLIIQVAEFLVSIFPYTLWRPITYLWFRAVSGREPDKAMRRLLEAEERLTGQINAVAIRYLSLYQTFSNTSR